MPRRDVKGLVWCWRSDGTVLCGDGVDDLDELLIFRLASSAVRVSMATRATKLTEAHLGFHHFYWPRLPSPTVDWAYAHSLVHVIQQHHT
jgi:hypothetical protein